MPIPQIKVRGTNTNPNALTIDDVDYGKLIGNHANVTDWFTPLASKVTLDTEAIDMIASRKVGSVATLTNGAGQAMPNYSAQDANFNGRPSVIHDSGGSGDYLSCGSSFPVAGDFFKVAIVHFASAPPGATNYFISTDNSLAERHIFTYSSASGGQFQMRVGTSGVEAIANVAFQTGLVCLIGTWDAATKTARISKDLGATWASDTEASAVVSVTAVRIGFLSDYRWTDILFGNIDLSKDNATAVELLSRIAGYARDIAGVDI